MATINITISDDKVKYLDDDFEEMFNEFILEYIETKEDIQLREELQNDEKFSSLNRQLEEKLWNTNL